MRQRVLTVIEQPLCFGRSRTYSTLRLQSLVRTAASAAQREYSVMAAIRSSSPPAADSLEASLLTVCGRSPCLRYEGCEEELTCLKHMREGLECGALRSWRARQDSGMSARARALHASGPTRCWRKAETEPPVLERCMLRGNARPGSDDTGETRHWRVLGAIGTARARAMSGKAVGYHDAVLVCSTLLATRFTGHSPDVAFCSAQDL